MEGKTVENALSWAEVQEICGEMEKLYRKDAQKDAQRLRALTQKRKEIANTVESKQSESKKQLQHLLSNLKEWEEHEAATKARHNQMQMKIQELDALKREMSAQLERLRVDEQYPFYDASVHICMWMRCVHVSELGYSVTLTICSFCLGALTSSKESLEKLLEKYEETRLQVAQYHLQHQHDIPFAKHQMSLYASVTGIKWDFSGSSIAGDIIVPAKELVARFEIDPATRHFDAANALWDKIDQAFEDIDSDLKAPTGVEKKKATGEEEEPRRSQARAHTQTSYKMAREVIENQRWYPILGWSARLYEDDPPPWCNLQNEKCPSKDEQKELEWHVYKSDDYDAEGWLYGANFNQELGPMTKSSVVRTRVWLGSEHGTEVKAALAASAAADAEVEKKKKVEAELQEQKENMNGEEWKQLFSSTDGSDARSQQQQPDSDSQPSSTPAGSASLPPIENGKSEASSLFPSVSDSSATKAKENEKVLFPSLPSPTNQMQKTNAPPPTKAEEKASGGGFFSKFGAAALSLPSSVINMAGESSKQAVFGTVQSIKEVSLYALDHAQAATSAAISSEPQLPAHRIPPRKSTRGSFGGAEAMDGNPFEVLSMLSKRFPDLSPIDRTLVTCCSDDIAAHLAPPEPTNSKQCKVCKQEFGMTKFRYQCGYCNESFCREDLPYSETLRAFGQSAPSKLCTNCHYVVMEKMDQQFIQWRNERVKDFLNDKLILYFNTSTDTAVDKIMRAAEGTLAAAKSAPMGATAKMAVVSADFVRKYGRAGLLGFILRNEFMQSFGTLKGLIGDLDDIGFHDAAIGTYYFMAMNRGERGATPESEKEEHEGCQHISDDLLADILKFAPLALHAIYELDVLDIQRISKLQNFSLIYAHIQSQDVRHPSFALLGNKEKKSALLLIRGSKSVQDLLTDIQAHPEEIGMPTGSSPREEASGGFVDAFAHNGMLKAAMWIKDRIVGSLRILHSEGYQITLAGHSLGAGCASLLAVMLQKEFENLQCFAYAVPACVNLHVAESCVDFVHSIVLRDDFVPRAKASNIMKLVGELKGFKGCWRETASDDLEAFKDRAKTLWRPRKREWAKEEADMRKGKLPPQLAASNVANDTKPLAYAEAKTDSAKAQKNEDQVSTWTLTRTNLIEQMDKSVGAEEQLVSEEARKKEEQVYNELVTTLIDDPKELYIPGRVTHVYFYKGIYEAVHVDRKCNSLSHVPVFQNMLSDHLGRNYLSALRVVRDTRRMNPTLPEWVPFSTKTRCMCCDSPFTWNSTSSSEAQQKYDQHNCRKCGWLVCGGCSEKWKSIPEFGINVPVRVCDRCFYEL